MMTARCKKTTDHRRPPVHRTGGLCVFLRSGKMDKIFSGGRVTLSALMLALGTAECYNENA